MSRQILRWNPYREIEDFFERYRRSLAPSQGSSQEGLTTADWQPKVDIREDSQGFRIDVELPGMKRENVKVEVEEGVLTIRGERHAETLEDDGKMHRMERSYGSFLRRFTLPEEVDAKGINATFKDGVLEISLPRAAEVKPKAIDIKIK